MKKRFNPIKKAIEDTAFDCTVSHLLPLFKNSETPLGEFIKFVMSAYTEELVNGEVAEAAQAEGIAPEEVLVLFRRGLIRALNVNQAKTG